MATHRAKVQCFHNTHLYEVGEEATFGPNDAVPHHFEPIEAEGELEVIEEVTAEARKGPKPSRAKNKQPG